MIGTSQEIFYYLTLKRDWRKNIGISLKRAERYRELVTAGKMTESLLDELLPQYGCRKLRNSIVVPALYQRMKNPNDIRSERTLMKMFLSSKTLDSNTIARLQKVYHRNLYPDNQFMKDVCFRMKWKLIEKRITLPSVWEYDPPIHGYTTPQFEIVNKIIHWE